MDYVTPTLEVLQKKYRYDPETGQLIAKTAYRGYSAGRVVGTKNTNGYLFFKLDGRQMYAHRAAWLLYYGKLPDSQIDHINGDRADNRIANLRDVSVKQNAANRRCRAESVLGIKGVRQKKDGKYHARTEINKEGRRVCINLGAYETEAEAAAAYTGAAIALHGEYALEKRPH